MPQMLCVSEREPAEFGGVPLDSTSFFVSDALGKTFLEVRFRGGCPFKVTNPSSSSRVDGSIDDGLGLPTFVIERLIFRVCSLCLNQRVR